jgi:hypothetical protein
MAGSGETVAGDVRGGAWRALAWPVAVAALAGGLWIAGSLAGRTAVTAGVLLLVVGLAALAVAVAGRPYGPAAEGSLDLSVRLGVGILGGGLGGLAAVTALWALGVLRITGLLGVALGSHLQASAWLAGGWNGAVWGLLLGVAYPLVPGRGPLVRGALFSLLPTLWTLLEVFPARGVGRFGAHLGGLTFLFVLLTNLIWGLVAGASLAWSRSTELAPVDRLPGEE